MHLTIIYIKLFALLLLNILLLSKNLSGQTLDGDTIFVNDNTEVRITFATKVNVETASWDKNHFNIKFFKNSIVPSTISNDSICASAFFDEKNGLKHTLIFCHKKNIILDSLYEDKYDFSTPENIKKFKEFRANIHKVPPPPNSIVSISKTENLQKEGNDYLAKENLLKAEEKFNEVLKLESNNYEANQGLDKIKTKKSQKINQNIELGNKAEINKDYDIAINEFNEVLKLDPGYDFALKQIEKIAALKKQHQADKTANETRQIQQKKQAEIINLKSEALKLLENKKYDSAIIAFIEVLDKDANDKVSKDKIEEIKKIKQQEEDYQKFNKLMDDGDAAMNSGNLDLAKKFYSSAKEMNPKSPKVLDKLKIVEKKIKEKEKENNYQTATDEGDSAVKNADYEKAIAAFNKAISIFDNRDYPKRKIKEIDLVKINKKANQKRDEKYKQVIEKADKLFKEKNFSEAKIYYTNAITIDTSSDYPKQKLTEIEKIETGKKVREKEINDSTEKAKKLNTQIESMVNLGENKETKFDYPEAISLYNLALTLKPGVDSILKKIEKINKIIAKGERDKKFDSLIEKGKQYYKVDSFALAATCFKLAFNLRSDDKYADSMYNLLKKNMVQDSITIKRAEEKATKEKYDSLKNILMVEKPHLNLVGNNENIKVVVEGLKFFDSKILVKFKIINRDDSVFYTKNILVKVHNKFGEENQLTREYITTRPPIPSGQEASIFYGIKELSIDRNEWLLLEVTNLTGTKKISVKIPAKDYYIEKSGVLTDHLKSPKKSKRTSHRKSKE